MDYQVWTRDEYEGWQKVDCGDKEAAMREIDAAIRAGKDPLLTVAIPYKLSIKLEEEKVGEVPKPAAKKAKPEKPAKEETKDEAEKSETEPGEGPGAEGEGEPGPGAPGTV